MAVEVGFFSLCFALILAVYGFLLGVYSLFKKNIAAVSSSRNAIISVFICVLLASLTLWNALFFHDFSVKYAYQNSSMDMPPIYLLTSFWSALEGSHLLWTLITSLVCAFALATVRKKNECLYPGLCTAFGLVLTFMLALTVTICAPLTRYFPVGEFGLGMNALLQNPYMAIHPPMLFTGYSLLIVPFAYSFAALINGELTEEWLITVRRFTLTAWAVLLIAISLGGKWAYVELGWGGYWGWDPVENSSFMPWLATTAALHTYLIYSKLIRLPRLALFLSMISFVLTFQGTFITRSGVISSVHSFAQSNIGPTYLSWIILLLSITTFLIFIQGNKLKGACVANEWSFSKESALLFTNFFILFLLALVFIGTISPLLIEAIKGTKISIQQPFFNAFAPWIGMSLVSLVGLGNIIRWRNGKIDNPILELLFPFICSLILTLLLNIQRHFDTKVFIIYLIVLWSCCVLIVDLFTRLKKMNWHAIALLKYNRSYLGSLIAHLGFLIAMLGFSGGYTDIAANVTLKLNESTSFQGYTIVNEGLGYKQEYNVQYVVAKLKSIRDSTGEVTMINPMRSKFTNNEQWFNEVGVYSTFWHDLYMVLNSFDVKDESITLKMNLNPTVKLVWTSIVVIVLGALVGLSHTTKRNKENIPQKRNYISSKIMSLAILMVTVGLAIFAFSGISYSATPVSADPRMADVAKELRCPTCLGMSVMESDTPQSIAMRTDIKRLLAEGKSKPEIIGYFKERYGSWILREPDSSSSVGLALWIIPIFGLILGPLFILYRIKKSNKAEKS